MRPEWSADTEERYQEQIRLKERSGYVTATLLAVVLFPAFSLVDLVAQTAHAAPLLAIRMSTTLVFGALHLAARRRLYPGGPYFSGVFMLVLSSVSITSMCWVLDGYKSPYYAGVNLVVLAGVVLFPWPPRRMAGAVAAVVGIWLFAGLAHARFHVDRPDLLVSNLSFLLATGVIGVAASNLGDELRREAFAWGETQSALQLRDEFVSIASHELKTPITSFKLQLELLRRHTAPGQAIPPVELVRSALVRLGRQAERLGHLVEEMLDLSRIRVGRLHLDRRAMDLGQLVSEVLDQLAEEFAGHGIELVREIDEAVAGEWDGFRIEQVVINLLINALKYGGGKPVAVSVRCGPDAALLEVRDQGPGIAEADRERIFERFERATGSTRAGGLGLGLYITRQIVEAHGGTIAILSEAGAGATFSVRLPTSTSATPPANDADNTEREPR